MISLRPFQTDDVDRLVEILNVPRVSKFLSSKIPNPYTLEDATWWVNIGSKAGFTRAITLNNQLIGCIGVNPGEFEYSRNAELGYWLSSEHWGKGIGTQAVKLITDEVFNSTEIVRIFAAVFSGNMASMKVLLKCGFKSEAVLSKGIYKDDTFYDNHLFAKLK